MEALELWLRAQRHTSPLDLEFWRIIHASYSETEVREWDRIAEERMS